ncbi:MAG: decaprenyl-phosphate phosphoribosyltransferase [Candidatus Eiseniibacteriota bacterium]|nr:MAG: decaprenyl-phosphate phosphoribosyltransferase [Candidatus Eisenbacteria bacterium]
MGRTLSVIIREARPHQWVKNFIVFAALIFSFNFTDAGLVLRTFLGFVAFCLLSGGVYVFNDIVDLESDRLHPQKGTRPLARGELSVAWASAGSAVLIVVGMTLSLLLGSSFAGVSALYLILGLLYSLYLKRLMIVDALIISVGFVLRAIAGVEVLREEVVAIELSPWLLVCTLFLALFMSFGKRRHEIALLNEKADDHRSTLGEYSLGFLDGLIYALMSATVISYSIYTISPATVEKFHSRNMVLTIPFVVYGIFRYAYLVTQKQKGGNPSELLLRDVPLIVTVLLWIASVLLVLLLS